MLIGFWYLALLIIAVFIYAWWIYQVVLKHRKMQIARCNYLQMHIESIEDYLVENYMQKCEKKEKKAKKKGKK